MRSELPTVLPRTLSPQHPADLGNPRERELMVVSTMKITVVRSGGFAGLTRTWEVHLDDQEDRGAWLELLQELPWGERTAAPQPDRYMYVIRVSRRRITLAERQVHGPWRELVDRVQHAAAD